LKCNYDTIFQKAVQSEFDSIFSTFFSYRLGHDSLVIHKGQYCLQTCRN